MQLAFSSTLSLAACMQNAGPEYKHMMRFMQSHSQFFGLITGPANFSVQNRNNPPYAFL